MADLAGHLAVDPNEVVLKLFMKGLAAKVNQVGGCLCSILTANSCLCPQQAMHSVRHQAGRAAGSGPQPGRPQALHEGAGRQGQPRASMQTQVQL